MQSIKRFLNPALLVAVAALLAATLALPLSARPAHAASPEDALDPFVAAINKSDGAAAAAAFTPDGAFYDLQPTGAFGSVGEAALKVALREVTDTHVKPFDVTTSGNTVRGKAQITDEDSVAAGISRYIQTFTAVARDGKLASFTLGYDQADPETATYLAYLAAQEDGSGPPPGAYEFEMAPGRDGAQTGSGAFFDFDEEGVTFVGIEIAPSGDGVPQPAQLVAGNCPGLGAVVSPLAPAIAGSSFTIVSKSMADIQAGDFAVAVKADAERSNRIVSCGETESAALLAAPDEPSAPSAPTTPPPPSGVITAPSTGTGPTGDGGSSAWLLATLAIAGAVLAATGATIRANRRTR